MARLPYIDKHDLPPQYRDAPFSDANITRVLCNSPNVAMQSGGVARYIRSGNRLDPRLRELAIIQVGYSTRNAYEYAHHVQIGLAHGVSEADVRALADETAGYASPLEPLAKAVLCAAREMTHDLAVTDATFAELRRHLDNECLVELLFAIANYNAVVRLLASLKVDLEDDYQTYLQRFPLPAA